MLIDFTFEIFFVLFIPIFDVLQFHESLLWILISFSSQFLVKNSDFNEMFTLKSSFFQLYGH